MIWTFASVWADTPASIVISNLEENSREREGEVKRISGTGVTFAAVVRDPGLQNVFSVSLGISCDVLVISSTAMGTGVLKETETMACAFQEMGTVACDFLGMGTAVCALLEMEIFVYALLEIEMAV
ncbi:hypothetical protein PR202_gb19373 [Eleusine coracana subsp. coracana]|uniref:Uncharacterized protein n=1 Tax=Eleusine coracana subsp. coracana TaxID=191504 RepID=A0AAV5F5T9_ELECO|nr:hypothetical protein PR202_gb19373 [Eleusine coracana subsp. coracana]